MKPRARVLGVAIVALFFAVVTCGLSPLKAQALSWTQVNSDGFSSGANNWGEIQLFTYQGKIYVGTGNLSTGGEIWRSSDGTTWEAVMQGGFGDSTKYLIGSFASFNGYLYASASEPAPATGGAQIWRSATGDAGTWSQVNTNGFSDMFNLWVDGNNLTAFNGYLYAGTGLNIITGAEVWRSPTGELGSWSQVNTDGFGDSANNSIRTMKVYNGYLYAGVNNGVSGSRIYRTSDGTTWETVNDNGFGDNGNIEVIMLEAFNGNLYAGTLNGGGLELWRSPTGGVGTWSPAVTGGLGGDISNTWPSIQSAVVNGVFWVGTRNDTSGGQLWYSSDGVSWLQESNAGFGDSNNYAIYTVSFNGQLYIGFSNGATGVEIWRGSGLPTLGFATESLPDGTVGNSYSTTLTASSGTSPFTYSLSSGSLPDGLSLNSNGVISGTPTRSGSYSFAVLITDSGVPAQTVTKSYTITVSSTISASILPETGGAQGDLKYLGWLALPILGTFSLVSSRKRLPAK